MAAVALRMPSSYVPVEAEEMEYIEGGVEVTTFGYWSIVTRSEWVVGVALALGVTLSFITKHLPSTLVIGSKSFSITKIKNVFRSIANLGSSVGITAGLNAMRGVNGWTLDGYLGRFFDNYIDGQDGYNDGKIKEFVWVCN